MPCAARRPPNTDPARPSSPGHRRPVARPIPRWPLGSGCPATGLAVRRRRPTGPRSVRWDRRPMTGGRSSRASSVRHRWCRPVVLVGKTLVWVVRRAVPASSDSSRSVACRGVPPGSTCPAGNWGMAGPTGCRHCRTARSRRGGCTAPRGEVGRLPRVVTVDPTTVRKRDIVLPDREGRARAGILFPTAWPPDGAWWRCRRSCPPGLWARTPPPCPALIRRPLATEVGSRPRPVNRSAVRFQPSTDAEPPRTGSGVQGGGSARAGRSVSPGRRRRYVVRSVGADSCPPGSRPSSWRRRCSHHRTAGRSRCR